MGRKGPLTDDERETIAAELAHGVSRRGIGVVLGRHHSVNRAGDPAEHPRGRGVPSNTGGAAGGGTVGSTETTQVGDQPATAGRGERRVGAEVVPAVGQRYVGGVVPG